MQGSLYDCDGDSAAVSVAAGAEYKAVFLQWWVVT